MKADVTVTGAQYELAAALLLYKRKTGSQYSSTEQTAPDAIATVHHVSELDGRPIIGAGRPMTEADYMNMVKVLAPSARPQMQWQDDSVLAKGLGRLIWWTPPMKRAMFFKTSTHFEEKSFTDKGYLALPGMVWQTDGRDLFVYAIAGSARPSPDMALYQAPLFNIWAKGQVCHGSANAPKGEKADDPKEWEKFLFGSHFTHPNFSQKDRLIKGEDPHAFWKRMLAEKPDTFPAEVLVPLKLKVRDLLEPDFRSKIAGLRANGEF